MRLLSSLFGRNVIETLHDYENGRVFELDIRLLSVFALSLWLLIAITFLCGVGLDLGF